MPFSLPDNVPDTIKNIPVGAQRIWVKVFNSVHADTKDEDKARIAAWSAVKNKYEKVNDEWRKKAMETWHYIDLLKGIKFSEDKNPISEIQITKIGEWKGHPTGSFKITEEINEKFVENFEAGERDVVVDYQHLSLDGGANDAKAAGWTKKLVNKGKDGLWAVVEWTKKAAEMIKEKEYRYISPEFHLNYPNKETKKKQGATLLAIALTNRPFLEGMAPVALSERALAEIENSASLDEIMLDINAWLTKSAIPLKGKKGSPAIRLYLKSVKEKLKELIKKSKTKSLAEESLDERRDKIASAYRNQFVGMNVCGHWVNEVFDAHIIVEKNGANFKVPFTAEGDNVEFGNPVEVELEKEWREKSTKAKEKSTKLEGGKEMDRKLLCDQLGLEETATDEAITAELKKLKEQQGHKDLVKSLGLKEGATVQEVTEAVTKLKEASSQKATEGMVKLAEFNQLKNEYAETKKLAEGLVKEKDALNLKLLEKDRDDVIGKALTEGKLVPANKELWEKQYMSNPEETKALLKAQPVILDLKEHGSGGDGPGGSASEKLAIKCSEKMATDPKLSYRDAFSAVQTENPVLATEYAKECSV